MSLKDEFLNIVTKIIKRDGIDELVAWLVNTDFFNAPASTRFHDAFECGLVMHSLNVYSQLKKLCKWYDCDATDESIAIVALFHDFCKIGYYKAEFRWRKDKNDKWEQYPTWRCDEEFAYGGHGSKSVYLIQSFIRLTPDEASAINCHMGAWDISSYSKPSLVFERNKLAWLLHVADEAATYIINKEEDFYE